VLGWCERVEIKFKEQDKLKRVRTATRIIILTELITLVRFLEDGLNLAIHFDAVAGIGYWIYFAWFTWGGSGFFTDCSAHRG